MATCALALLLAMIAITAVVALRKKAAPVKEPPMHPSVIVVHSYWGQAQRLTFGETFQRSASALAASDNARFSAPTPDSGAAVRVRRTIGVL